jgi:hypothetical protein
MEVARVARKAIKAAMAFRELVAIRVATEEAIRIKMVVMADKATNSSPETSMLATNKGSLEPTTRQ